MEAERNLTLLNLLLVEEGSSRPVPDLSGALSSSSAPDFQRPHVLKFKMAAKEYISFVTKISR